MLYVHHARIVTAPLRNRIRVNYGTEDRVSAEQSRSPNQYLLRMPRRSRAGRIARDEGQSQTRRRRRSRSCRAREALALQAVAPEHVSVELITPEDEFVYRPLAVAEPFHVGEMRRFPLARLVAAAGAELRLGALAAVDPDEKRATLADGSAVDYDVLVLALGAQPLPGRPGRPDVPRPS
jgi:hypothetical protein